MSTAAPSRHRARNASRRAPSKATVLAEIAHRVCFLSGPAQVIHEALTAAQAPRRYDRERRAFAVPLSTADDVLAALEMRAGVSVERRRVAE